MSLSTRTSYRSIAAALVATSLFLAGTAQADSGAYVGASVGSTTLQADFTDTDIGDFTFDENDFSWKVYGGYKFDLPVINLGLEVGYVDLGGPSVNILDQEFGLDITAWEAFGIAGFDVGPVNLFAKAGFVSWDVEATIAGLEAGSDDGSDPAYGVGAAIELGGLQLRAEYEMFDISDVDDLYMLSAGIAFSF
jgi:hypothetical protein